MCQRNVLRANSKGETRQKVSVPSAGRRSTELRKEREVMRKIPRQGDIAGAPASVVAWWGGEKVGGSGRLAKCTEALLR